MKRPQRNLALFNLSALDVLAMATGVFVLIVVLLLPYYRKSFDAHAQIEAARVSVANVAAEIEAVESAAAANAEAAAALRADAAALAAAAAAKQSAAATMEQESVAANRKASSDERDAATMQSILDKRIIKELDLVFVVDTTASMTPVLQQLALSMGGIVRVLERLVPSLRVGFVAYRDHDYGRWTTRHLSPTPTDSQAGVVYDYVEGLRASPRGGPSPQEAVYDGLREALALPWRPSAKQTIIVVGDAAAHTNEQQAAYTLAHRFATSGPRRSVSALFVTTPSQQLYGRGDRAFFQELARAGAGEFNDHGGRMIESVLLSVLD